MGIQENLSDYVGASLENNCNEENTCKINLDNAHKANEQ